jgi:ABC-2 type transport system permease protein
LALTVHYLGQPDNGVILAGYLGSFLMAGAYLAIACFTSAMTKNQVVSFILGVMICLFFVLVGWGVFSDLLSGLLPVWMVDGITQTGFISHYTSLSRGLIDTKDIVYFISFIALGLALNILVLESRKAA